MSIKTEYENNGFYVVPEVVIPPDLLQKAVQQMRVVFAGYYETGIPPLRRWNIGHPKKIQKMDSAHVTNHTLFRLATHPKLAEWAAKITGAKKIQAWSSQLFFKPPQGGKLGNVGWHRDHDNWTCWEGELFTAWIALSTITTDCGPLVCVKGSNRWNVEGSMEDPYQIDMDSLKQRYRKALPKGESWEEVPVLLPPGGMSFHQRGTVHGSRENETNAPRCAFAILLRTENSDFIEGAEDFGFRSYIHDPMICPVIYSDIQ